MGSVVQQVVLRRLRWRHVRKPLDKILREVVLSRLRRGDVYKSLYTGRLLGQRFRRVGKITLNLKLTEAGVGTPASFLSL